MTMGTLWLVLGLPKRSEYLRCANRAPARTTGKGVGRCRHRDWGGREQGGKEERE